MSEREPVDVYATRRRGIWLYLYDQPCTGCGRIHFHGGGDGELPDLKVGEVGTFGDHCTKRELGPEDCRLVRIVARVEVPAWDRLSPTERSIISNRLRRERDGFACDRCGPRTVYHKTSTFHARALYVCDKCSTDARAVRHRRARAKRGHTERVVRTTDAGTPA